MKKRAAQVLIVLAVMTAGLLTVHSQAQNNSLSGSVIAYQVSNGVDPVGIHVMDIDGKHDHLLTDSASNNNGPAWSPDGRFITFTSDRDGHAEIYVMKANGENTHRLTNTDHDSLNPSWSPDGNSIVYDSCQDSGSQCEIYVMDADGRNPHRLVDFTFVNYGFPAWSPNGDFIAFNASASGGINIYLVDANGNNLHPLTNGIFAINPTWSPDSKRIAFSNHLDSFIYVIDIDGKNLRDLSHGNGRQPAWSPDGKHIAFVSLRNGKLGLWLMDADGKNQHSLTQLSAEYARPAWKPSFLIF
jgi:TolB protein